MQEDNARLIEVRSQLWKEYYQLVCHMEMYWFQQAKAKWVTLGDINSRFFHQATLMRRSKNRILALQDEQDQWVYEDNALRALINQFFLQLYMTNGLPPAKLVTVCDFPEILPRNQHALGMAVSLEETKGALFSMQNFKALGPDGLHPVFFKSQWDTVGPSILSFVQLCFENPMMVSSVNHMLLTLIPKCTEPARASQFRPIALCNVIYKIVTEVIAQRLRAIMPYVVADTQSSFVLGRSTIDNILVLQETIHSFKHLHGKTGYMLLELDLEKAYDRIEWSFVMDTLASLGIPTVLQKVILHYMSSTTLSVNWNGSSTDAFKSSRGIRQGDPISPYLFVLCLERLGHMIKDVVASGVWKPFCFRRGNSPKLSHICFTDDLILVAEASSNQVQVVRGILDRFCSISG